MPDKKVEYFSVFALKPDAFERNISFEIIKLILSRGFMWGKNNNEPINLTIKQAQELYPPKEEWIEKIGNNIITANSSAPFGLKDPMKAGLVVATWVWNYICRGPIMAVKVFNFEKSIDVINELRDHIGDTDPERARVFSPESIRGKFGNDSFSRANSEGRTIENLVHGSASWPDALREAEALKI